MDRHSRSPDRIAHPRKRSRSPKSHAKNNSRHDRRRSPIPRSLPMGASPLHKRDFAAYEPMFALYLDVQKQIELEDLSDSEVKGRWKGFVGRWNRGELAEGWYDPMILRKAQATSASADPVSNGRPLDQAMSSRSHDGTRTRDHDSSNSGDEEDLGPALPLDMSNINALRNPNALRSGPSIPTFEDLELQKEQQATDAHASSLTLHRARQAHHQDQKALREDLAPRQDPGTRARALEKRADARTANNAFAAAKLDAGADVPELAAADVFGGGDDDGVVGFKRRKAEQERVRTERELRREAIQRARTEEREERGRKYRRKEEAVMRGLVEMAKKRFG